MPNDSRQARILIQLEYIESPHLRLTRAQVGRLCDLPHEICAAALSSLVASGFLLQTNDGSFVRGGLMAGGASLACL